MSLFLLVNLKLFYKYQSKLIIEIQDEWKNEFCLRVGEEDQLKSEIKVDGRKKFD